MTGGTQIESFNAATGWYRGLAPEVKRVFWACFGGWALDAMDVQIFSFAIPAIIATFNISKADAGLIGTVTLLTSAFGGWFAGALADRFGRVRTLQITILWFAVFTLLCGFAQSYTQLLILRALMGFGFGGEWAAGAVLMGEMVQARHRGKAVGSVQSGWAIGWAIAAIVATVLFSVFSQDVAWRALFWVGVLPALMVFFVRRFVQEPPIFQAARQRTSAQRNKSAVVGDFFTHRAQDHRADFAAGNRSARRVLRNHHLAADLPQGRTQAIGRRHRRVYRRRHCRFVHRVSGRRLSRRPYRAPPKLHAICRMLSNYGTCLHATAD